jgi:hypothetical protein
VAHADNLYRFAIKWIFFVGANLVFASYLRANTRFAPTGFYILTATRITARRKKFPENLGQLAGRWVQGSRFKVQSQGKKDRAAH